MIPSSREVAPDVAPIRLEAVWRAFASSFGEEVIPVAGVDLEVGVGEFVGIIGPSGSGKTTILNLMAALILPSRGEVHLGGVRVSQASERERTRLRRELVGMVFQGSHLFAALTALENVVSPARTASGGIRVRREERARALQLLASVGLDNRASFLPSELSQGQRRRVALARALFLDPPVILADEPTADLDEQSKAEVIGILTSLHIDGRTLVVATHDPEVAAATASVLRINHGRLEPM